MNLNVITSDDIDFEKYLATREEEIHSTKVRSVVSYEDAIIDLFNGKAKECADRLPWAKTQDDFWFRDSELSIWAGQNGSGKSLVLGQVMAWANSPSIIASMEMPPAQTAKRIMQQVCGTDAPTVHYLKSRIEELKSKVFIYDQIGNVSEDQIIGMCHFVHDKLGIKHVVIDSLVKCGIAPDDYAKQTRFASKLQDVAKATGQHISLVVHLRKGIRENEIPDKYSVKGAGELVDLCDNLFLVYRQKEKKNDLDPDGFIRVAKQRHHPWEGAWGFWYHDKSLQWTDKQGRVMEW